MQHPSSSLSTNKHSKSKLYTPSILTRAIQGGLISPVRALRVLMVLVTIHEMMTRASPRAPVSVILPQIDTILCFGRDMMLSKDRPPGLASFIQVIVCGLGAKY